MSKMDIEKQKRMRPKESTDNCKINDQFDEYDFGKGIKKQKKRGARKGRRDTKRFMKKYGNDIEFTDNFEEFK